MPDSLRLEEVENVSYAKRILTAKRGPTTVTHVHMDMCLMLDQHQEMIVVLVSSQYFNELCKQISRCCYNVLSDKNDTSL